MQADEVREKAHCFLQIPRPDDLEIAIRRFIQPPVPPYMVASFARKTGFEFNIDQGGEIDEIGLPFISFNRGSRQTRNQACHQRIFFVSDDA